jgi:hypothetical protein
MTNPYLKSKFHQQMYARTYANWAESVRLGNELYQREAAMFPSTVGGSRGSLSPLGGQAVEKSEKGSRP